MKKEGKRKDDVWLTNNYWLSDFDASDGTPVPLELMPNAKDLARAIELIRKEFGEPIGLNSVYRTPETNKNAGGKKGSYHLKCMAVDLEVDDEKLGKLYNAIHKLMAKRIIPKGGLKRYSSHVHYDIRGRFVTW